MLERQVRRMLADRARRGAGRRISPGSGCSCATCGPSIPDQNDFPDFDDNLRQAFRRETELLFQSVVREDRSVLDLLTADYTFVNERLARHYGIPHVYGSHFRRVPVHGRGAAGPARPRQHPAADLASRPHVAGAARQVDSRQPARHAAAAAAGQRSGARGERRGRRRARVREQMEIHRKNPACAGCHRMMDPLGLALENFDAVGAWRTRDAGIADRRVGPSSRTGRTSTGVAGLRQALLDEARLVRQHDGGEDADLRARPWARVLRPAGGPRRSRAMRRGRIIGFRPSCWGLSTARRSGCGPTRA